jgi:hypothetical protein
MIWRYRDYVPVAPTVALLLVALQGYSGSRAWRLGPPLGATMDHDFRAVLRAARAIQAGDNPYAPALEFGRSPSFQQFLTWEVAPYPYPPLVAILARPLTGLASEFALKLWSAVNLVLIVGSALVAVLVFADNRSLQFATRFPFMLTLFYFHGPTQIALLLAQLVPFQADFDKLSSCGKLQANSPLQEESNAQQDLHRRLNRRRTCIPAGFHQERQKLRA